MRVFTDVDELIAHMADLGRSPSDDDDEFTELDHALQCAARLAVTAPGDVELQIAGLLHDLAHQWDGPGQPRHGELGAAAVRPILGERLAALIEGHVPAKRYLVATRPAYAAHLSPGSVMTLRAQGGEMSLLEVRLFESNVHWEAMVLLREADDDAKVPGAVVRDLAHWVPALRSLV
jgi:predicted HD phosphohydrolase